MCTTARRRGYPQVGLDDLPAEHPPGCATSAQSGGRKFGILRGQEAALSADFARRVARGPRREKALVARALIKKCAQKRRCRRCVLAVPRARYPPETRLSDRALPSGRARSGGCLRPGVAWAQRKRPPGAGREPRRVAIGGARRGARKNRSIRPRVGACRSARVCGYGAWCPLPQCVVAKTAMAGASARRRCVIAMQKNGQRQKPHPSRAGRRDHVPCRSRREWSQGCRDDERRSFFLLTLRFFASKCLEYRGFR